MTVSFRRTLANGTHPVITYPNVRSVFRRARTCTSLEDRHPNRIDVRVLGGKLLLKLSGELKLIGVQQFRRHPPNRALALADSSSSPMRRFIDNRRKPKVRQACTAPGIYQDVNLAASFSVVIDRTVTQELTPLRSPWTMSYSCRYSNPVTAPTSYSSDQRNRGVSFST